MKAWPENYIGLKYDKDHDCAWFVKHVLKAEANMDVKIPTHINWRRLDPEAVMDIAGDFADQVFKPQKYDGVLMKIQGNQRSLGSHIGIYAPHHEQEWILHHLAGVGSIWTPKPRLVPLQLEIVRYYRWK